MPERHLKIGAIVKTRLVPPYATNQIGINVKTPPMPKVGYKSAAGHTEYKDAPQDSPEWAAYATQVSEIRNTVDALKQEFTYDYAIEAWSWDDGATWQDAPPDSWQFPEIFKRYGLKVSDNRRVDYIHYKLLVINEDISTVVNDAIGKTLPISNAEVDAALGGFPSNVEGREPAGK